MSREQQLRAALVERLRETNLVVLRHEDMFTAGLPDISVTGHGRTLWVEVKVRFAKKSRRVVERKIQRDTMTRLAVMGLAVYVVYDLVGVSIERVDGYVLRNYAVPEIAKNSKHNVVVEEIQRILRTGEYLECKAGHCND